VKQPVVATRTLSGSVFDCRYNGDFPVCCRSLTGLRQAPVLLYQT